MSDNVGLGVFACHLLSKESNHTTRKNNSNTSGRGGPPRNEWERNCRFEVHGVSEPVRHDLITAGVTKGVGAARCHSRRTWMGGLGRGRGRWHILRQRPQLPPAPRLERLFALLSSLLLVAPFILFPFTFQPAFLRCFRLLYFTSFP